MWAVIMLLIVYKSQKKIFVFLNRESQNNWFQFISTISNWRVVRFKYKWQNYNYQLSSDHFRIINLLEQRWSNMWTKYEPAIHRPNMKNEKSRWPRNYFWFHQDFFDFTKSPPISSSENFTKMGGPPGTTSPISANSQSPQTSQRRKKIQPPWRQS